MGTLLLLIRRLFSLLPLLLILLLFSPSQALACSDQGIDFIVEITGSCNQSMCAAAPNTDPLSRCNVPPTFNEEQCPGSNADNESGTDAELWEQIIEIHYKDGRPACSATAFFLTKDRCENPIKNSSDNGIQGTANYPTCATGTCNPDIAQQQGRVFTGYCDTLVGSYCTGNWPVSCPSNASDRGPGEYCQSWACGYDCNESAGYVCEKNYDSTRAGEFSEGSPAQQRNLCTSSCFAPVNTPTPTPTPTPTTPPTPTPIPVPGTLSCSLSTELVDKSVSGRACTGNQWCVKVMPSYQGNGTNIISPVYQTWDFGNGSGINNSDSVTYRGYDRPSGSTQRYTISLAATENNGASGARQATCSKNDVDVPPPGQSLPTPTPGGRATPTPAPPTPTNEPLSGTGAIRFYNANCTTPYDGTDTLTVLTHARNANAAEDGTYYENDIYRSGGGHNALFYNGTSVAAGNYSHNANEGVRGCDSRAWHPYYDPGYMLNADGTVTPCGGGSGSGYSWKCEEDGDWREPDSCEFNNNDGSYGGTTECCKNGGSLRERLDNGEGSCVNQDSYSSSSFPYCSPNNNSPTTINATNNRVSLTSTRGMKRTFNVAGPTGVKLKVIAVCVDNTPEQEGHAANPTCDWQGVENPTRNPNRGSVQKQFNDGAYPNYYASGWDYSSEGEGTYVYDVCVRGNTPTISGNVFLDKNADGDKDTGEPGFGGGRVFVNGVLYPADPNGNYTAADLELGGNYTVDIDPPADYRVTTGNDPTTFNNLRRDETVNFGITPIAQAWFQTMDADILALGTIISKIPMQCITPACTPQLGLPGSGGYPGIPMFGGSNPNFGYGTVSEKRWLANSRYNGDIYNYAYFQRKMPANAIAISGNVNAGDINGSQRPYTWYYSSGDLNITSTVNYGRDEKVIIFVNGNLTIKGRITINKGTGFFAAIVSGNINIDPGVSHPNQPALEGVYLADGTINTASPAQAGNDTRLYVRGSLAAPQGTINLSRDLDKSGSGIGNQTTPAEYVEYAPDLLLNFPPQLLRDNPVWEEVAP